MAVDYSKHYAEIAANTGVPVKLTEQQRQKAHQDHYTEIAVHQALTSEHFRKLLREEIFNAIANAEHLRGASGTDGAPGEDGATIHEILSLLDEAIQADPERFRGKDAKGLTLEEYRALIRAEVVAQAGLFKGDKGDSGKDVSVAELRSLIQEIINEQPERFRGLPGHDGKDSVVPGPTGKSIVGPRGESGRDGKDAVSLDQIREAVVETVVEVLKNEVSQQLAQAQIAAIRQELLKIDQLADTRPSLRPIFSDMTSRIRNIIR